MSSHKLGTIAFVVDERIPRERSRLLTRIINGIRHIAHVELVPGGVTEDELIKKLSEKDFHLVLAPWYRYLSWTKVEAYYGLTRTSGPTFAGYFADQLLPYELGEQSSHHRSILLDFANLSAAEVSILVKTLIQDHRRTGIRPFFEPGVPIYCENWYGPQGLGARTEAILTLPEIANSDWAKRAPALRICLMALWSLVYEEGAGKGEFVQAVTSKSPRAYFQLAADGLSLVLRLCTTMGAWTPREALDRFWPDPKRPTSPEQLLLRYADFVRLHKIADQTDIEVVAGFFASSAAEAGPDRVRTLWVEPIASNIVTEAPYEAPGPNSKHLRPLPVPFADGVNRPRPAEGPDRDAKERFIFDAAVKIRQLKELLTEKEELIQELRSGGVGTSQPLPPPDAESLLEAFQERYFEARFQIRQFEVQIARLEQSGATLQEIEAIRLRMQTLASREQAWIRKIAATIESVREAKKREG